MSHDIVSLMDFFSISRTQWSLPPITRLSEHHHLPVISSGVPHQTTQRSHPQCPPDSVSLSSAQPLLPQTISPLPTVLVKELSLLLPPPHLGKPLLHPPPPQEVGIDPLRRVQRWAGSQHLQRINHSYLLRLVSHPAGPQPHLLLPMVSRALWEQQTRPPPPPDCLDPTPPAWPIKTVWTRRWHPFRLPPQNSPQETKWWMAKLPMGQSWMTP